MKKYSLFLLIASVLLLTTCNDQRTFADLYDIDIQIPDADQLLADSTSSAILEIDFGSVLNKDQEVEVTTSHGLLFAPPYMQENISNASNSVKLEPFDNRAEVLLLPHTLTPTDPVFVTVTINGLTENIEARFQEAFPEDLQLSTETLIVEGDMESITVKAELYRENGYSSNGLRFVPRAELEAVDSSQVNELLWSLPDFVLSKDNKITIPITIIQHVTGSQLRVFLSPFDTSIQIPEKSILIRFE